MSLDVKKLVAGIHDYLGKAISPLAARMNAIAADNRELKALVAELQQQQQRGMNLADAYRFGWQPQTPYSRGSLVTFNGSLWLSLADTDARPGHTPDWRLILPKGRDGKDAAA